MPTPGSARPSPTSPPGFPRRSRTSGNKRSKTRTFLTSSPSPSPPLSANSKPRSSDNWRSFSSNPAGGFNFVGRQYRLDVGDDRFYIHLLFYNLRLRAFVVIELKKGKFEPEYAGKLNFYRNVVNDRLKHPTDAPTIGMILRQTRDQLLAEYSFAAIDKPIGIST